GGKGLRWPSSPGLEKRRTSPSSLAVFSDPASLLLLTTRYLYLTTSLSTATYAATTVTMLHLEFLVPPQPQKKSFLRSSKPRPVQTTPSILHSSIHLPASPPRPVKSTKHSTPGRRVRFDLPPTPTTPSAPAQCLSPGPPPAPTKEYRDIPLESMTREQKAGGKHVFLPQYTPTPTLPQILAEIKMLESTHPHSSTNRLLVSLVDQLSRTPSPNRPPSSTAAKEKPC